MSDFNLGNPIPWEPVEPNQIPVPIRERVPLEELERAQPFPTQPDREVLEQLERLEKELLAGGQGGSNGGGKKKTGVNDPFPDDQGPTDPIDALASYVSFRSSGKWGVFISRAGLLKVGSFFVHQGASPFDAYQIARYMLQNHETCHFLVDRAVLTLETNFAHVNQGRPPQFWLRYSRRHLPYSLLEEAVCNAYAYRMADASAKTFVRAYMELQPNGYRDVRFTPTKAGTTIGTFQQSESQLLSDYQVDHQEAEGRNRVIGLNSLMQYNKPLEGKNGDLYFTRPGNNKEELPVYLV